MSEERLLIARPFPRPGIHSQLALSLLKAILLGAICSGGLVFEGEASAGTPVILFEQPALKGVAGNFAVPLAEHRPPPMDRFGLLLWQPNPYRPDGTLVPTIWPAGDKMGFFPSQPLAEHQSAFRDATGASTVQIDGDTVGAYLDSGDLPNGSDGDKLMITPEYLVAPASKMRPFADAHKLIHVSLDVQIPTATDQHRPGSMAHVNANLLFTDVRTGLKLSYGCNIFTNGRGGNVFHGDNDKAAGNVAYDEPSHSVMANGPVAPGNRWLDVLPGSAVRQGDPWRGWKHFEFVISEQDFRRALSAVREQYPEASDRPEDYAFAMFHLNAELHFRNGRATLGWSMRHATVILEDAREPLNATDGQTEPGTREIWFHMGGIKNWQGHDAHGDWENDGRHNWDVLFLAPDAPWPPAMNHVQVVSVLTQVMNQISPGDLAKVARKLNQHHISVSLSLLATDNTPRPDAPARCGTNVEGYDSRRRLPESPRSSSRLA